MARSTKGRTWEEIYGAEYAEVKRALLRKIGQRPKSEQTKKRLSEAKKRSYAEGRHIRHQLGKPLTEEHKRKISATRRQRFGTRASLNKRVRYTSKYRQWRTMIFRRDQYTCQRCGINTRKARKRVMLHVHHITPLWVLLTGLTFDEAMESAEVWDPENVETLCLACHRRVPVGAYWCNG